ncbi:hypothetical protein Tco_1545944 [Tanacetum coccineum]
MRPLTYPKLFLGDTKKIPRIHWTLHNALMRSITSHTNLKHEPSSQAMIHCLSIFKQHIYFRLGDNYVDLNGNITQGFRKTEVAIGCVEKQLRSLIIVTENLYKTVAESNTHEFRTDITKLKMSLKFLVTSSTSLAWSNTSRLLKIKSTKATMDSDNTEIKTSFHVMLQLL